MFEALAFDLDNTLVDRQAAMAAFVDNWLLRRSEVTSLDERRAMVARALVMDNRGDGDRDAFYRWFVDEYGPGGVSSRELGAELIGRIADFVRPDVEVQRLLHGLAKTHRLALVTNGSSKNQRRKLENSGLRACFAADGVFVSEEVGVAKPQREIFLAALDWLGCVPSRVLFVGDSLVNDIGGAAAVSMKTCWIAGGRALSLGEQADWSLVGVADLPGLCESRQMRPGPLPHVHVFSRDSGVSESDSWCETSVGG